MIGAALSEEASPEGEAFVSIIQRAVQSQMRFPGVPCLEQASPK
jgi:hypothetical protein